MHDDHAGPVWVRVQQGSVRSMLGEAVAGDPEDGLAGHGHVAAMQ
ncbi:hypothetical protein ACH41H_46645 [Streptomyces sp. NPDC020800]